jgi:hypothetical protein
VTHEARNNFRYVHVALTAASLFSFALCLWIRRVTTDADLVLLPIAR